MSKRATSYDGLIAVARKRTAYAPACPTALRIRALLDLWDHTKRAVATRTRWQQVAPFVESAIRTSLGRDALRQLRDPLSYMVAPMVDAPPPPVPPPAELYNFVLSHERHYLPAHTQRIPVDFCLLCYRVVACHDDNDYDAFDVVSAASTVFVCSTCREIEDDETGEQFVVPASSCILPWTPRWVDEKDVCFDCLQFTPIYDEAWCAGGQHNYACCPRCLQLPNADCALCRAGDS